jgi:hypothetical protein
MGFSFEPKIGNLWASVSSQKLVIFGLQFQVKKTGNFWASVSS